MKKPKLNIRLLKKIRKHILEEPKRLIMDTWVDKKECAGDQIYDAAALFPFAKCGTAACIGGWAMLLSNKRITSNTNVYHSAQKLLGLSYDQADHLFSRQNWPINSMKFSIERNPKVRVKLAAQLLDKVIETKGAILGE